jgi:pyridoxal phosphate enzyme (YggS family)
MSAMDDARPEPDPRRREIADRLHQVTDRITAACAAAGRPPDQVHLIAVTKTFPASDVLHLAALGVADVGENRDQEAAGKAAAVSAAGVDLRWHFVGRLQRNKCRSVVRYADWVHSVDSVRLAAALGAAAAAADRTVEALVQVSLDGDPTRGGAVLAGPSEVDLARVTDAVASAVGVRLAGLMAVAPIDWEPEAAFARLAEIAHKVRVNHPTATVLSAGMSGDLEAAVRYGATHIRIGTALLSQRPGLG